MAARWPETLCSEDRAYILGPLLWRGWIICTDGTVLAAVTDASRIEGPVRPADRDRTKPFPRILESEPVDPVTFTVSALRKACGRVRDEKRHDLDRTAQFRGVRLNLRQLAFLLRGAPNEPVALSTTDAAGPIIVVGESWRGCLMPLRPSEDQHTLPDLESVAAAPTEAS